MLEIATVLLRHETRRGGHFDFMIEDPAWLRMYASEKGVGSLYRATPLLTWRCTLALAEWPAAQCVELEELPPHRREYLDYEGELTGDRGSVRRVDRGHAIVHAWTQDGGIIELRMRSLTATVALERITAGRWRATIQ